MALVNDYCNIHSYRKALKVVKNNYHDNKY